MPEPGDKFSFNLEDAVYIAENYHISVEGLLDKTVIFVETDEDWGPQELWRVTLDPPLPGENEEKIHGWYARRFTPYTPHKRGQSKKPVERMNYELGI
jgi:hypothetical protein